MAQTNQLLLLFSIICVSEVLSGSWLACTDYTEKNGRYYDPSKCRGFPRAANKYLGFKVEFGEESGYSHEPTESKPCREPRNDYLNYDSNFPMAIYYPGQQVVLAHPMKEHGADADCTNPYIPDTGNWIYRGEVNSKQDISFSEYRKNLVFDLGTSPQGNELLSRIYPKPGYQNAPAFCLNQDKSLGTYSFNIPLNLSPGRYSFMWLWAFNNMDDLFTTCFEVMIVRDQIERNHLLKNRGIKDLSEPCGGITSNPKIRGSCNRLMSDADYSPTPRGASSRKHHNVWLSILAIEAAFVLTIAS